MNISIHRARKGLKAKRYSPNFIILPIFGPNRGSLWPIWRTRSQSKRETRLEERSGGSVFAVFLFDRFVRTCDLFFLGWWRLWRPNFFQRRLSTTIAQRAFQHGLLATRISKRRDFLTCRSSSTGPSNFLATPSCPVIRTQTIIVKVVYFGWQFSQSVGLAGWQAKMASFEICIPWRNAHKPHWGSSAALIFSSFFRKLLTPARHQRHTVGRGQPRYLCNVFTVKLEDTKEEGATYTSVVRVRERPSPQQCGNPERTEGEQKQATCAGKLQKRSSKVRQGSSLPKPHDQESGGVLQAHIARVRKKLPTSGVSDVHDHTPDSSHTMQRNTCTLLDRQPLIDSVSVWRLPENTLWQTALQNRSRNAILAFTCAPPPPHLEHKLNPRWAKWNVGFVIKSGV